MRVEEGRWVGAGPGRVHARASGFSFETRGDTERVSEASGKMLELCFRDGSREAVRKLCQ